MDNTNRRNNHVDFFPHESSAESGEVVECEEVEVTQPEDQCLAMPDESVQVSEIHKDVVDDLSEVPVENADICYNAEDLIEGMAAIASAVTALDENVTDMLEKSSASDAQAEILKSLASRVKAYEEEFVVNSILKPIIQDFILLHDSLIGAKKWTSSCGDQDDWRSATLTLLEGIENELTDAMKRHGLSTLQDTGDVLDPSIHKVVRVNKVECQENKQIAERLRGGWMFNGRVVRPTEVVVNHYTNKEGKIENEEK